MLIYEDLEKEKFSVAYYNPYFMSLLQLEEYKKAEKLARKLVKKFPTSINYQLEIGICQQKSGDQISAEKTYEKIYLDFQGKEGKHLTWQIHFYDIQCIKKHWMFIYYQKVEPF